jgi:hypothetical protein
MGALSLRTITGLMCRHDFGASEIRFSCFQKSLESGVRARDQVGSSRTDRA